MGGSSLLVSFIQYSIQVLYFGFINYLWGGILDHLLSSSFLLLVFGSLNSLWGGIPQKFPFNFSCVHCLPKWTKSMSNSPRVSEQSLFLPTHVPVPSLQHVSPRLPSSPCAPPPPLQHGRPRVRPAADEGRTPVPAQGRQAAGNLLQAVALVAGAQGQVGLHEKNKCILVRTRWQASSSRQIIPARLVQLFVRL